MTKRFKPGEVVRLKSGGPKMTITEGGAVGGKVTCRWFSKSGVLQTNVFETILLEHVMDEETPDHVSLDL